MTQKDRFINECADKIMEGVLYRSIGGSDAITDAEISFYKRRTKKILKSAYEKGYKQHKLEQMTDSVL